MAFVAAMSAVAINTAADVSTTGVFKIEVHKSRSWIVAMAAMMALMIYDCGLSLYNTQPGSTIAFLIRIWEVSLLWRCLPKTRAIIVNSCAPKFGVAPPSFLMPSYKMANDFRNLTDERALANSLASATSIVLSSLEFGISPLVL